MTYTRAPNGACRSNLDGIDRNMRYKQPRAKEGYIMKRGSRCPPVATMPSWVWALARSLLAVVVLLVACTPMGGGPSSGHTTSGAGSLVPIHQSTYDVACPALDPAK